jgi:hypothetical protein
MDSPTLLTLYQISGWLVNLIIIGLAIFAIRSRRIWNGKYLFLGLLFCILAVLETAVALLSNFRYNTFYLNFVYVIFEFCLLILYLGWQLKIKHSKTGAIAIVLVFVFFQIYQAVDKEAYKKYDSLGIYINTSMLMLFSISNLTIMFTKKSLSGNLRGAPDFWFTTTIFFLNFLDLFIYILTEVTYDSKSDRVFFMLYISRNVFKSLILYGYYKGIKLLT